MKVLSIGNSFSQDAHKWLHPVARAYNGNIHAVNLYIGGCSLQTHWENFLCGSPAYDLEINGVKEGKISITEALRSDNHDVITFQQASHFSGDPSTYYPYLTQLYESVRNLSDAKVYIHQTWAYEKDADHSGFAFYSNDQKKMYNALTAAYRDGAQKLGCPIIPVGDAIQYLREHTGTFDYENGGLSLNRDGFHLSWLYGRYAAALVWYKTLLGGDISKICFIPEHDGQVADVKILQAIHTTLSSFNESQK